MIVVNNPMFGLLVQRGYYGACQCRQIPHIQLRLKSSEVTLPNFDYQLIKTLKPFPLWLSQGN